MPKSIRRRRNLTAGAILVALATVLTGLPATPANDDSGHRKTRPFVVFNGLHYQKQPDLTPLGLTPIQGIDDLCPPGAEKDKVDELRIRNAISPFANSRGYVYLDMETWSVVNEPDNVIAENIAKLIEVARITRKVAPKLNFGYYGLLPDREYWPLVQTDQIQIAKWRKTNLRTAVIAKYVDVIFPSLYTFYDDEKAGKPTPT